jgi:hypothetical protein
LEENVSYIDGLTLIRSNASKENENLIAFTLGFTLKGLISNQLTQKNWEKAYNKHDNSLRIAVNLDIKINGKVTNTIKLVRKAIFFYDLMNRPGDPHAANGARERPNRHQTECRPVPARRNRPKG